MVNLLDQFDCSPTVVQVHAAISVPGHDPIDIRARSGAIMGCIDVHCPLLPSGKTDDLLVGRPCRLLSARTSEAKLAALLIQCSNSWEPRGSFRLPHDSASQESGP